MRCREKVVESVGVGGNKFGDEKATLEVVDGRGEGAQFEVLGFDDSNSGQDYTGMHHAVIHSPLNDR